MSEQQQLGFWSRWRREEKERPPSRSGKTSWPAAEMFWKCLRCVMVHWSVYWLQQHHDTVLMVSPPPRPAATCPSVHRELYKLTSYMMITSTPPPTSASLRDNKHTPARGLTPRPQPRPTLRLNTHCTAVSKAIVDISVYTSVLYIRSADLWAVFDEAWTLLFSRYNSQWKLLLRLSLTVYNTQRQHFKMNNCFYF